MMIFFFRGTRGGKGDLLNILKIIDFFFKVTYNKEARFLKLPLINNYHIIKIFYSNSIFDNLSIKDL